MTYDLFPFFNELDLLEIRLNILDPYVDCFVLMESKQTFSGKEKPLYYQLNESRFAKWKHKIVAIEVLPREAENAFERAFHQKEALKLAVEQYLAKDEDTIYYGDVDEIWKPQIVGDDVLSLRQLNYCYHLNNRSSEEWVGTIAGKWGVVKTKDLAYWRATHTNVVDNGGWHFTNMGGAEQILKKLEAYDHQEFNNETVKGLIQERIENGEDYVGRSHDWKGRPFAFHRDEIDLPQFLLDSREKYKHLFL